MLELLALALFSQTADDFWSRHGFVRPVPQIEVLAPARLPQRDPTKVAPKLLENPDTALLALDLASAKELFAKDASRPQPIASITKLMTALIILEENEMDEIVSVLPTAARTGGTSIDLYEYEKMTVRTLLEAILIVSANDGAMALALHNSDTIEEFVDKMNAKAQELGLTSARFYNPTGLDVQMPKNKLQTTNKSEIRNSKSETDFGEEVVGNVMSARDVAKLARTLWQYEFVRETVAQDHFYGTGFSGGTEFLHEKPSTNQLLGTFLNLKGLKTGYTPLAGQCFVSLGETDGGAEVLTVILGSEDRFGETKKLLSWIYDSFEWK